SRSRPSPPVRLERWCRERTWWPSGRPWARGLSWSFPGSGRPGSRPMTTPEFSRPERRSNGGPTTSWLVVRSRPRPIRLRPRVRSFGKWGFKHDEVGTPAMNRDEALGLLERSGALLSGHFELTSGLHSDRYVQKARVL